jgi:hypothetical protein
MSSISPEVQRSRKAAARYAALSAVAEGKARQHLPAIQHRVSLWHRVQAVVAKPAQMIMAVQHRRRAVPKRLRTI